MKDGGLARCIRFEIQLASYVCYVIGCSNGVMFDVKLSISK